MIRSPLFVTLALIVLVAIAVADDPPQKVRGHHGVHTGRSITLAKTSGDTIYLIGNPQNPDQIDDQGIGPVENGTFEDQFGIPSWNGWTSEDATFSDESYWQVSDFNAVNGDYSYWCGTEFADGDLGYGNDWNQVVLFRYQVPDNAVSNTVNWSATIQNDTEPGYDYTYMEWNQDGIWNVLVQMDGDRTFNESHTFTYNPGDYVGSGADEIQLRFRFASDGAWSDEDDLWETDGACQVDDVTVTVAGETFFEDFEDQVADDWVPDLLPGVGDYAEIYVNLQDEDPCNSNFGPQVAFPDTPEVGPDGFVEEFQAGQTWRYGPGGYIVNNQGGPAGPDFYINNLIISPAIEWPAGTDGCAINFNVFRHEELGAFGTWPGIFYQWHIRSVNTGDPADLEGASWEDRNFVYYGGPDYLSTGFVITDLLTNGRTHVQVGMRCIEYGYVWGWVGTDGTPAPYFDNIRLTAYPFAGPGISGRAIDWLQDNFPARGDLDLVDLGNNSVPLDAAQNIAQADDLVNYPGDSMWFDVSPVRGGAVLNSTPRLYVRMRANPLFDPYRTNVGELEDLNQVPDFFEDGWTLIEGYVEADSTFQQTDPPTLVENRWNVSLPDEGFFFPGDVLKWYIWGEDNVAGDIGVSLLPADTAGYASFTYDLQYPVDYVVRALPTLFSDAPGDQPRILFWNDFVGRGGDNEWLFALNQLGYELGIDYDMYATNGPSSGVGNGLGGRATSALLAGYQTMLYTAGDLSVNLMANGDFNNDPSNDITVVSNWFAQGDKNALFTGDEFVRGMLDAGATGAAFVNTYLSVNFTQNNVGPLIDNQTAPLARPISGNSILTTVDEWIAYGGCNVINAFDAVEPVGTSERIAEFCDANGNPGQYTYAAGIYNQYGPETADIVYLPYDFIYIYNAPGWTPPGGVAPGIPARTLILRDILDIFGHDGTSPIIGADPPAARLQVSCYPNPFNPATTIELILPRAGEVSLKIFNVRGELVRTLVDGEMAAGEHQVVWDGRSDTGRQAASGIYFHETRANGEVTIDKMALVK
ncbi:hypothetical protein GF314_06440 [bacterium]|nr:hypothetical protein [bacterium]